MLGSTNETSPRRSWDGAAWAVSLLVASVALVAAIHVVPYLPTNDGPQIVLSGYMENHYSDAGSIFPEQVEPALQFAHRGFSMLFLPLEELLGWQPALRVTLSVIALTTAWGFVALVCALSRPRRSLGLLGFAVAFSWQLYMGFFSFEWATGIGLLILAFVIEGKDRSILGRILLALALGLQSVCHVFAAVLTGAVLVLVVGFRSAKGLRLKELGGLALTGLPAMAVLVASLAGLGGLTKTPLSSGFVSLSLGERIAQFPYILAPGPDLRAWLVLLIVLGAIALAVWRWRHLPSAQRALCVAAIALLAASLLTPLHMPGWQFLSPHVIHGIFGVLPEPPQDHA